MRNDVGVTCDGYFASNGNFIAPRRAPIVLLQFTGLKDKNGREIYEGDILIHLIKESKTDYRDDDGVRVVVDFGDGTFRDKYTHNDLSEYLSDWPRLEIIGNICENPGTD